MLRRRIGAVAGGESGTFDGSSAVGGDDGYWINGSFDNTAASCFVGINAGNDPFHSWARVDNVTVPQGATIDAAYMEPYTLLDSKDGTGVKTNVYLNDIDDAVAPTDEAEANALALTAAFTAWDDQDFATQRTQSPDMAAVFKEIVDRGGWNSGQAMMFVWRDDGSTTPGAKRYKVNTYEATPTSLPFNMHIEWST